MTNPAVTVIVPTHDHPTTLALSIRSVLEQTFDDIAVVILGDGVRDDTRDVVSELRRWDARVSFVDTPKSPRHAETERHAAIQASQSPVIAYHGDDDLLLPHHLAEVLEVLNGHDFAHPLPLFFDSVDTDPVCFPMDLTEPGWVAAQTIGSNHISLTGVVHTRESYMRLPYGWRQTPQNLTTDDYMWRQFFAEPWFRGATSPHATTIKLSARARTHVTAQARGDEITMWWDRMHEAGFFMEWQRMEDRVLRAAATRAALQETLLRHELTEHLNSQWQVRVGELRRRLRRS